MTLERPIQVVVDGPEWVVVEMTVPGCSPVELLTWFVDARKLNQWWGEEALIEPRVGGTYLVRWPSMGWTMRGVVAFCDEQNLVYSWTWDHEPNQPARAVIVRTESRDAGAVLTVTHGAYRPSAPNLDAEIADRDSHREGWLFFLGKLRATMMAAVD